MKEHEIDNLIALVLLIVAVGMIYIGKASVPPCPSSKDGLSSVFSQP